MEQYYAFSFQLPGMPFLKVDILKVCSWSPNEYQTVTFLPAPIFYLSTFNQLDLLDTYNILK